MPRQGKACLERETVSLRHRQPSGTGPPQGAGALGTPGGYVWSPHCGHQLLETDSHIQDQVEGA